MGTLRVATRPYDEPCQSGHCRRNGYWTRPDGTAARHTHLFCAGAWIHPSFGDRPYCGPGEFRPCGVGLPWPRQYVWRTVPGGIVARVVLSNRWDPESRLVLSPIPCPRCGQALMADNGPDLVFA